MAESRMHKTLLNARVNLVFYFLALILSFFSRKIFLSCLGTDFIGLVGTLQNLLGFLNLAELGVGAAIGYVLYKPIFDHDHDKINEIISVMGYVYRWIGIIILGAGLVLSIFLPFIFPVKDTGLDLRLVFFAFYSLLASSLLGYFINYRQNLLGADQRNYIVTACFQTVNITKIIIQLFVAYYTRNPLYWVVIELVFGVVYSLVLNSRIYKTYPWLKANLHLGKRYLKKYPEVLGKSRQLFIHQLSLFSRFQLTPLVTYACLSLNVVACLENYTMLFHRISILLNRSLESITASIGNLIAEGNHLKIVRTFWSLTAIRLLIAGSLFFGCFVGVQAFITAWLGEDYVLPKVLLVLILTNIYLELGTGAIHQFIYGYGLFGDVWAAIVETGIFLILAVIVGKFLGLKGILAAGVVSTALIQCLWKPYYLYSRGFKDSTRKFWLHFLGINGVNALLILAAVRIVRLTQWEFTSGAVGTLGEICLLTGGFGVIATVIYYCLFPEVRALVIPIFKK